MANHKRIVLCDEAGAELDSVAQTLRQHGYDVVILHDAARLVPEVIQSRYAVVVVNPDLPGFDAAAVCQSIKKDAGIPVILIPGANSNSRNTIDVCTADDVMTKPIDIDILANLIEKNFTWSRAVQE